MVEQIKFENLLNTVRSHDAWHANVDVLESVLAA